MLNELIENMLLAALFDCTGPSVSRAVKGHPAFRELTHRAIDDVAAFASKDPASRGDARLVAQAYTSYKAVLHYRLANWIWKTFDNDLEGCADELATVITSRGKLQSGADIHHRCEIGERFVLDHGYGTVIGETTRIGNDCYVLNGVTLGATGIAANCQGKRHPTVGDRVEIGAFARIYGPVVIGDDVFIGPRAVVTEHVPSHSIITVRAETTTVRRRVVGVD